MLPEEELTEVLIAGAMEVHKHLGPGLLESAYEECYCHELKLRNVTVERQKQLPLHYTIKESSSIAVIE